jgi:hypothetical protein
MTTYLQISGLRDEAYSLYHALRSFGLVYAAHSISRGAFELLWFTFAQIPELVKLLPLAYRLLAHMAGEDHPRDKYLEEMRDESRAQALRNTGTYDPLQGGPGITRAERDAVRQSRDRWRAETPPAAMFGMCSEDWDAALPIPDAFFTNEGASEHEACYFILAHSLSEFPFPAHLVIYHACAHESLPRDVARRVFIGIGCSTKGRQRDQFRHYSLRLPGTSTRSTLQQQATKSPEAHASFVSHVTHRVKVATRFLAEDYDYQLKKNNKELPPRGPRQSEALRCLFQTLEECNTLYTHAVCPKTALGTSAASTLHAVLTAST